MKALWKVSVSLLLAAASFPLTFTLFRIYPYPVLADLEAYAGWNLMSAMLVSLMIVVVVRWDSKGTSFARHLLIGLVMFGGLTLVIYLLSNFLLALLIAWITSP